MAKEQQIKVKKQKLQDLQNMRKKSKRLELQIAMECSHQKPNGDLDVHWVQEETNTVCCNICDDVFSMEVISQSDLKKAQKVLNNAIQQMRALATDDEQDVVENLGRVNYAINQVPKQYSNLVEALGKGGKKKKKNKKKGSGNKNFAGYEDLFEAVGGKRRKH